MRNGEPLPLNWLAGLIESRALVIFFGGPTRPYVLTTRYTPIALQFAQQSEVLTVHELEEKESMTLLTHLVPNIQEAQARHLVQVVGGLPLALMLMGKYLLLQSYSGQPRRIQAAFDRLGKIDERFSLSAPQAALESTPTLSQAQPITMQDIIKVSDSHLSPQAQASLRALSVFPAKPNTFSEAAALAVANTSFEVLDELSDVGLLESGNSDRYTPRCRF